LIRLRDEERGAVAAIVAISLICLIGMLVLTFDLGHSVALKRNMVNGTDAAALAAARECGLARGEPAAMNAAADLLVDNNEAATLLPLPDGFQVDPDGAQCDGSGGGVGRVTVGATVPVEYFFAPIFGFNNGTVEATATAEWEAGVQNPIPVKLDLLKVEECEGLGEGADGPECYFVFEKDKTGSQRGWLNLPEGWPIQGVDPTNPKNCASQKGGSNDLKDYIDRMGLPGEPGVGGFQPALWDPPPTWVCAAGGVPDTAVQALVDWMNKVAKMVEEGQLESEPVVFFPVVACDGAAPPCYLWKTGSQAAYPVIDLQGFYVRGAEQGNPNGWPDDMKENCEFTRKSSDVFCIHLAVAGDQSSDLGGVVNVRLVD
jgi:hypothetical protein